MSGVIELTLERDGHDQPWGFRLQGGADVGIPLSIQRILVGTPADGILKRDDVILKIGNKETKSLSHQQAADLFTKTGNQIRIALKRTAKIFSSDPSLDSKAAHGSSNQLLNALPKTKMTTKEIFSNKPNDPSLPLTIQNQPYRTNPLIQPSIKVKTDLEPGSASHLRKQADHISQAHGPLSSAYESPASPPPVKSKVPDYAMQQKGPTGFRKSTSSKTFNPMSGWQAKQITGSLLQHSQPAASNLQTFSSLPQPDTEIAFRPVPEKTVKFATPPTAPPKMQQSTPAGAGKQVYNTPINLYSAENVAEVAKMNEMGLAPVEVGPTAKPLNPMNKPLKSKSVGKAGLPIRYDPEKSATWQAIKELEECQLITEHGPPNARLYSI